jgi:hypothetical protein
MVGESSRICSWDVGVRNKYVVIFGLRNIRRAGIAGTAFVPSDWFLFDVSCWMPPRSQLRHVVVARIYHHSNFVTPGPNRTAQLDGVVPSGRCDLCH